jgi:hypothetical protein
VKKKQSFALGIPGMESSSVTQDDVDIFNTVKVNMRREPDSDFIDEVDLNKTAGKGNLKR